ncbi:MAG: hypothetical protein JKX70_00105, partial [Phycisphaerales bacterium]|nr:hypothetical protein [Phycisphaerales bacterium]
MQSEITRRNALAGMAALSATGILASAKSQRANTAKNTLSQADLGWDQASSQYTLPD